MRRMTIVFAVLAVVAVGCSKNESPAMEKTAAPSASAMAAVNNHGTKTFTTENFSLELEQDNFYFSPTYIKAPGNATAKLEIHNEGSVNHTFTIDALGIDKELKPDEKMEVEVKLGAESRYEFYCRFHKDQGMRGAFTLH